MPWAYVASLYNSDESHFQIARKIFGYDAEDEANEWWTKWGSLQERAIFKNITAGWEVEVKHEEESALE